MHLGTVLALWILSTTIAFAQSEDVKNFPIKLGDTYERVKEVYQTPLEPEPYRSAAVTRGSHLRLKTKGVWFFFTREGKIYTIRFDAPYNGTIGGMKIGDNLAQLQKTLGKPVKSPPQLSPLAPRPQIYYLDDATTANYYVNSDDEIETIFLVK